MVGKWTNRRGDPLWLLNRRQWKEKESSTRRRGRLIAAHRRLIGVNPHQGTGPINRRWAAINRPLQRFYTALP